MSASGPFLCLGKGGKDRSRLTRGQSGRDLERTLREYYQT